MPKFTVHTFDSPRMAGTDVAADVINRQAEWIDFLKDGVIVATFAAHHVAEIRRQPDPKPTTPNSATMGPSINVKVNADTTELRDAVKVAEHLAAVLNRIKGGVA